MNTKCNRITEEKINLRRRMFICQCGQHGTITKMFDCDGNETKDEDLVISVVVQLACGGWKAVAMSDFEPGHLNS